MKTWDRSDTDRCQIPGKIPDAAVETALDILPAH